MIRDAHSRSVVFLLSTTRHRYSADLASGERVHAFLLEGNNLLIPLMLAHGNTAINVFQLSSNIEW